jgi:hypothetical protein
MKTPARLGNLRDCNFSKRDTGSRLDLDQSAAFESLAGHLYVGAVEKSTARMTVGHHAEADLQLAHGVAQFEIEVAVEIGDFVTERCQPVLEGNAFLARGLHVVRRPGSENARQAAQPVGEHGNRERIGVRIVEALEHDEIVGDQKSRTCGAAREEQDRLAGGGQGTAIGSLNATSCPFCK